MPCHLPLSRTHSPLNIFKAYRFPTDHQPQVTRGETEAKANAKAKGGDSIQWQHDTRSEVRAVGEVKIAAVLCPKAIPVGDKIRVCNRFPAWAPPPQWGPPSGARNALVSMFSFTGHLSST